MKHSRIVQNAIKDVRKIKACGTHCWVGPIKEIKFLERNGSVRMIHYEVRCKTCPLVAHFINEEEATEAIK